MHMSMISFSTRQGLLGALALSALLAGVAVAHDYGVQGKVWEIIEVDMREVIMRDVVKHDWDKEQAKVQDSADKFFDNLPKHEAHGVAHTKTRWIDPSFVLNADVYGPVKDASGEFQWKVLFPKGTRANPLAVQRPYNVMLFFDGTSKDQVAFVSEAIRRHPGKLLPVELSGSNPKDLASKLETPVFSATDSMVKRFNITETPSLLFPGVGEHSLELGLTTYGPPFSQDILDNTWPEGLRPGKAPHP
jgi:conjugal transfer pilus assembly protein TraW